MSSKLQFVLKSWSDARKLSFIAVDEAHCVDAWGHGFHPDFLKLVSMKHFAVPIIALTGTATQKAISTIVSTLAMDMPSVIKVKCARTNLFLQIQSKSEKPLNQVADFITANCQGQRGIVYCSRRKDTVDLAHKLKLEKIDAVFVHGGLPDVDRKKT
ncbi:ATP-dependent DNA helicase Q-like 1 [Dendronephthya gigantea]|uniref:ATP-dependent DNA helicase Q-like 1 n=1 Tax=Dendronephthya gigantea TaxID=151771 RepID=UPI00106A0927|nr:ATP-dependent DNA helicase Q-like 1 [Dendronephthya gigantea]